MPMEWPEPNTVVSTNLTINSQPPRQKPNLVIDFDGVIHSYSKGWQGGDIYGEIVPGFFEWAERAKKDFTLIIYSSRSGAHKTRQPMEDWLSVQLQGFLWDQQALGITSGLTFKDFQFATTKPPAFVTIDDRAITFNGNWGDAKFSPENLLTFKPWNNQ
jgi:hypothetical protein